MIKQFFLCFILLAVFSGLHSAEFIFRDDPFYADIDFLFKRGAIDIDLKDIPLRSDRVISAIEKCCIEKMNRDNGLTNEELYAIDRLLERYAGDDDFKAIDFFRGGVEYSDSVNTGVENRIMIKKEIPGGSIATDFRTFFPFENTDTTLFRMDEWKGTGSDCYNTYVSLYGDSWFVLLGRSLPAWGQGEADNIFISRKILPMDGILAEFLWNRFKFSFWSAIKGEYHYSNKMTVRNSFLSAHKIEAEIPFSTSVSFKEMILYRSNLPQLYYLNPAMFYYIIQYNSHSDDNIFWSFEISNRKIDGLFLGAELFIDDYQYETEEYYKPNKTAVLLTASYSPKIPFSPVFSAEYCRINTYTNTHEHDELAYMYYSVPMSYLDGTDMDNLMICARARLLGNLHADMGISYLRRGEGEILNSWEEERPDTAPTFPSGNANKTMTAAASVEYTPFRWIGISLGAEFSVLNGYDDEGNYIENKSDLKINGNAELRIW